MDLLQVYFRYSLNILHLKTDIIQAYSPVIKYPLRTTVLINSDIKTHSRLNINQQLNSAHLTAKDRCVRGKDQLGQKQKIKFEQIIYEGHATEMSLLINIWYFLHR